ncbi:MAG: hypothetical protein ACREQY_08430, partial [Candidatus Binatia bacterium]
MLITEDCVDPRYNTPVIDAIALVPQSSETAPPTHWVVHGQFVGTPAVFGFYYPVEGYQGRFWQGPTHQLRLPSPAPGVPIGVMSELATDNEKRQAFASGAYVVESSPGSDYALTAWLAAEGYGNPESAGYRVSAAAAKFSRVVAAMPQIYGPSISRPYGYIFGGSGGGYQTITASEQTIDVWDGFVPFVIGSPLSIPDNFTIRLHAKRVLTRRGEDQFLCIMDAIDPGGSGDPLGSCDLDEEEKAAFLEAHHMGFPPKAWYQWRTISGGPLFLVAAYVPKLDPTYVDEFWSLPGYLGTEQSPAGDHIREARIQHHTTVVAVTPPVGRLPYQFLGPAYNTYMLSQYITGPVRAVTLASLPPETVDLTGASLVIESGPNEGTSVQIALANAQVNRATNTITFAGGEDPDLASKFAIGDEVRIDNGFYLALQTHQRHVVTDQYGRLVAYD